MTVSQVDFKKLVAHTWGDSLPSESQAPGRIHFTELRWCRQVHSVSLSAFSGSPCSLHLHYPHPAVLARKVLGLGFSTCPGPLAWWCSKGVAKPGCAHPSGREAGGSQLPQTLVTGVEKCFPKGKLRGSYQKGEQIMRRQKHPQLSITRSAVSQSAFH